MKRYEFQSFSCEQPWARLLHYILKVFMYEEKGEKAECGVQFCVSKSVWHVQGFGFDS